MKKLFILSLLLSLLLLTFPQKTFAQGTFQCNWVALKLRCGTVGFHRIKCDSGFQPDPTECQAAAAAGVDRAECLKERVCKPQSTPQKCFINKVEGIPTAIGCIPTGNLNEFANWFLRWAIGIGGGIAFLLIIWSGFQIMTSSGNPERLKAGKEQLTAAVTGLLFLIFSVFLLRLIGVEILRIPGFIK